MSYFDLPKVFLFLLHSFGGFKMTRNQVFFSLLFLFVFLSHISDAQMETVIPLLETDVTNISEQSTEGREKGNLTEAMIEEFEAKHKDEDMIILSYNKSIEVNEDWSYVKKTYNKRKILTQKGKRYGDMSVTYEKGVDDIVNISAYTTTSDGEKYSYTKMHDVRVYEGYKSYSNYRRKTITLPQVNVGSVIEYEKEIRSKGKPIKGEYWKTFSLGFSFPVLVADISISFPKSLKINYKEFKLEHETKITETDDRIIYSWHFMDVHDDEKEEEFEPYFRMEDMKNIVEFSSIEKWSDISDWYNAVVKENLVVTPEIKNAAVSIFEGKKSIRDKARAMVRYMTRNFRYVSMVYDNNKFEPHRTDEVFRNKYGDCKDIAVLCKTMLEIGGIDSDIVFFNNEYDLSDPQYDLPDPGLFDHVLLLVRDSEGDFYLDPFLEGYDIGEYPMSYQAGYCFVINDNGGYFDRFPIFDKMRKYQYMKSFIEINGDGSALYTIDSLWSLNFSIEARQLYAGMSDEEMDNFLKYLNSSHGEVFERRWENSGPDDYGRIKSYLKYMKKNVYADSGGVIVFHINAFGNEDRWFTRETREKPIFFPQNSFDEDIKTYKIPNGYKFEHIPVDIDMDIGFFRVTREYKVKGREITITEKIWNKRMEIPASEYPKIKDFFDSLGKKTKQRIVLKKRPVWIQNTIDIIFAIFKGVKL